MTAQTPEPLTDLDTHQLFKDAGTLLAIVFTMLDAEQREAVEPTAGMSGRSSGKPCSMLLVLCSTLGSRWRWASWLGTRKCCTKRSRPSHQCLKELLPAPYTVLDTLDEETARAVLHVFGSIVEEK